MTRNYSYLLTTVITENQLVEEVQSNNPPDLEVIGRTIYLSRIAEELLETAVLLFKKAASYVPTCPLWLENIEKMQSRCQKSKDNIEEIRKKLFSIRKVQPKQFPKSGTDNKIESILYNTKLKFHINRALDYILTQRKMNFQEMGHKMLVHLAEGFNRKFDYQVGDVFQRALLIDTLLDAQSFFLKASQIIKKEVETLVAVKLKRVRGGWSYFPLLPELPPDADSLGQILQVLVRSKYKKINEAVSDPVSLLLSQCSYDDGSFETWIVDNNDTSKETQIIKSAIENMWQMRMGKDNEVLANILHGLYLYNFRHLKDRIKEGVNCLEKRQTNEGYWNSRWYWGHYYGTYVVTKIIKVIKPGSSTLKKAENFILNNQNYDGGWGLIGSDPLNTALALLSLTSLKSKNLECIINGINYLCTTQTEKGYWDRIEFGRIETPGTTFTYKSKTITTQFCLKALIALVKEPYLKEIIIPKQIKFTKPQPQIYHIYEDFVSFIKMAEDRKEGEKRKLLNSLYINPNKIFFKRLFEISSIKKDAVIDKLILYKKDGMLDLIKRIKKNDLLRICQESIKRCFENLPMNQMPDIYLWIGNYTYLGENCVINDKSAIIISLEFFTDLQLALRSIPLIIACQYIRIILKRTGILRKALLYELYETGLASYFSRETFPEFDLASHLFFTSAQYEWCRRNEWFLKREMKPYLQSNNTDVVNNYMSDNPTNNDKWFPNRTGFYVGYRIIEEYLNKEYSNALRDLISESPVEVIARSNFFKILN